MENLKAEIQEEVAWESVRPSLLIQELTRALDKKDRRYGAWEAKDEICVPVQRAFLSITLKFWYFFEH